MSFRSRAAVSVAVPVAALALLIAGAAQAAAPDRVYVQLIALKGNLEKPHGDPTANGTITLCISKSRSVIAFNFDTLVIPQQPTAGHIHKGAPGVSGPVVFPFAQPGLIDPSMGEVEWADTAPAKTSLIAALLANPKAYYVNVHTKAYPNGAIRGQLGGWKLMSATAQGAIECGVGT